MKKYKNLKCFILLLFSFFSLTSSQAIAMTEAELVESLTDTKAAYDEAGTYIQNETKTYNFVIDSTVTKWNVHFIFDTTSSFSVSFIDPDQINVNDTNLPSGSSYLSESGLVMYSIANPKIGTWQVIVNALSVPGENSKAMLRFSSDSLIVLDSDFIGGEMYQNDPISLRLNLTENESPLLSATVSATITNTDTQTTDTVTLLDDGAHNDELANDGIYGIEYTNTAIIGNFTVRITAEGNDANGYLFRQYYDTGYQIIESSDLEISAVSGEALSKMVPLYDGIEITLAIDNYDGVSNLKVLGNLYDYQDNRITNGSGIITGDETAATATLFFPGEPIWEHKVDGPYTVKDLTVIETSTYKFISKSDIAYQTQEYIAAEFTYNDQDKDGLSDSSEQNIFNTNYRLRDTDLDGLSDYEEINYDGDPTTYSAGLDTDPLVQDTDGDTYIDGLDDFPLDNTEWLDTDKDGYGDNSDYYPNDSTRWESPDETAKGIESFDFNLDGYSDVLWQDSQSGDVYVWLSGSTDNGFVKNVGSDWNVKGVEDLDGDFKPDIVLKNKTTGEEYIWLMDGNTIKAEGALSTLSESYTINTDILSAIDWNKTNYLLLKDTDTGKIYVWLKENISEPPVHLMPICHGSYEMNIYEGDNFQETNWEPYDTWITYSLSAEDGEKILNARFRDESLTEITAPPVTIVIDRINPQVTITSPVYGDTTTEQTVTVQGTINEPCYKVFVNGVQATTTDTTFSADVSLNTGENILKATAIDLNGNSGISSQISVTKE